MFQLKNDTQTPFLNIPTSVWMLATYLSVVAILPYAPSYCWFLVPFFFSFAYFFMTSKVSSKQLSSDAYPDMDKSHAKDVVEDVKNVVEDVVEESQDEAEPAQDSAPWIQYSAEFVESLQHGNWTKPDELTQNKFDEIVEEASTPAMTWQHASIARRNAWFNKRQRHWKTARA
jgi:hypothetical protein